MTPVPITIVGAAVTSRDDARVVPWRDARFDKLASAPARMLVHAVVKAWPPHALGEDEQVGVYLATGETGLDVDAFLDAAHVAWDDHPDDPDYRWMGGRALRAIDPYYSLRTLANGPAALLAMHLGATGPSLNVAQQPYGAAWALLAALDDLANRRCDVAVVGACDVPSVPTRRAIAQRLGRTDDRDEAAALILRWRSGSSQRGLSMSVRWEPAHAAAVGCSHSGGSGVVDVLRELVQRGEETGWAISLDVVVDAGNGCRAVIAVEA